MTDKLQYKIIEKNIAEIDKMFIKADFFNNIKKKVGHFSLSKRNVANYVLSNYQKSAFMTAKEIAENCGVSESTVNRFSKDLGYSGFPSFTKNLQNIVHAELSGPDRLELLNLSKNKSKIDYLHYLIEDEIQNLNELSHINKNEFDLFVTTIIEFKNLLIVGSRFSSIIVHYLYYGLCMLKDGVKYLDHIDSVAYDQLELIEDDTLIIAVGLGRYPKEVMEFLEMANTKNIKIVTITDSPISPFIHYSQISLIAPVEIQSYLGTISAPSCLVAAIISEVSLKTREYSIQRLRKLEGIAKKKGIYI